MDLWWLLVPVAYLIGTFPTALLVGRFVGHDPRSEGSGNPGATNVYRVAGRRAGAAVLAGDLLKGAVPTAVGLAAGGRELAAAAGAAAILGHIAPVTRRFRGGKGFATGAGVAFVLWPLVAVGGLAVWVVSFALFRRASVSTILTVGLFPLGVWLTGGDLWEACFVVAFGLLIVGRHHENIRRLLRNEEEAVVPVRSQAVETS